jgi:hypothetical protein
LYLDYDRICKKKSGTIPFPWASPKLFN